MLHHIPNFEAVFQHSHNYHPIRYNERDRL